MTTVLVSVEDDPTPLVGLIAGGLRRRLAEADFSPRAAAISGVGVICDRRTPQAVSLRFDGGSVRLEHGAAADADATLAIDFPGGETAPEIRGGDEHEELVELLGAVLTPVVDWREAAAEFWRVASARPGAPGGLLVHQTESEEKVVFGAGEATPYEIHGTAEGLTSVFVGRLPLADAVVRGAVFVCGGMVELSILTGASFAIMVGGADA